MYNLLKITRPNYSDLIGTYVFKTGVDFVTITRIKDNVVYGYNHHKSFSVPEGQPESWEYLDKFIEWLNREAPHKI